jgi:hypothetical protein
MRFKLVIENPNIEWKDFKELIASTNDSKEILKACYNKSKRCKGLGFSKKS